MLLGKCHLKSPELHPISLAGEISLIDYTMSVACHAEKRSAQKKEHNDIRNQYAWMIMDSRCVVC